MVTGQERHWIFPAQIDGAPYDGDSIHLELDLGFCMKYYASVRLVGVDTPEMRGGTDVTKGLAIEARDETERFIRAGERVEFKCVKWGGKYGRPIGDIIVDGKSLAQHLIDSRLGVEYHGGTRAHLQAKHAENAELRMAERERENAK